MQNYPFQIITDSGCDISPSLLAEWDVACESLTFRFNDSDREYGNSDMPTKEFYQRMRDGGIAKTAAINTETFSAAFEKAIAADKDVLYLGFSSGISNTYNAARLAAEQLREKHPARKIFAVDTLCASAGEGLLVYLATLKRNEGATIEEVAQYVEAIRPDLCHWFTVDNLTYLKRGGRVSPTTAIIGNALHIKPVMHVDDAGKLTKVTTAHGRKKSIAAMAAKYKETAKDPAGGHVFISHGDCEDDAKFLAKLLYEQNGVEVELITDVGPVIGAHSGPGTLALFFVGSER
ncbi:MAG: DegV family protein [Clostridia bacterium]|nr:DegV family protein [Clostridia bacterium]